jgi:hypothetical protein
MSENASKTIKKTVTTKGAANKSRGVRKWDYLHIQRAVMAQSV